MKVGARAVLVVFVFACLSCSDVGEPSDKKPYYPLIPLAGWRLVSVEVVGVSMELVPSNESYTMDFFTPSECRGLILCNYWGSKVIRGPYDGISFSDFSATEIGCPNTIYTLEFRRALENAKTITQSGNQLKLYYLGGTRVLHFTQIIAP